MGTSKITLAGQQPKEIDMESLYLIDFSKCSSVNDLMIILSSIGFTFSPYHPGFETLKPFLNLDQPIPANPQKTQPAKETKLELPKLKMVKK